MNVTILTPSSRTNVDAQWVDVQTTQGNRIILPGHEPFVARLARNKPIALGMQEDVVKSINAVDGLIEVTRQEVIIILDE